MSNCPFFCIAKLGPIGSMLKFNHGTIKNNFCDSIANSQQKKKKKRVPLFSCKKPWSSNLCGWVALHCGRKKAILHHFICSSHANKSGSEWNKNREWTSPPPRYTAHTRSLLSRWQKNNNNTIVFVSFTNGWSWRTSLSWVLGPGQVLMPWGERLPRFPTPLPNLHLFPPRDQKCLA